MRTEYFLLLAVTLWSICNVKLKLKKNSNKGKEDLLSRYNFIFSFVIGLLMGLPLFLNIENLEIHMQW